LKKLLACFLFVTMMFAAYQALAQDTRAIVPYPRDITVEVIDPMTKAPKNVFCIGVNAIDVKLTNNGGYRQYVSVVNRDTSGKEQALYTGWLESGVAYLSTLIRAQLEVTGPAGMEMIRVDTSASGQMTQGRWVTFYVQDCGGQFPPGGGYGQAFVWAQIYPYAIPQGGKGTITLQTNVASQTNQTYYFEILNSWGQLWKRFPVSKRPYEPYQVALSVGKTTKVGMLTYTVKLYLESGVTGERREVASTYFSFHVIAPGTMPEPYVPGYQGYPNYQGAPGYPEYPGWSPSPYNADPYSSMPYGGTMPYLMPQSGTAPYDAGYPMGSTGERPIN
jgi:hypothetical protein